MASGEWRQKQIQSGKRESGNGINRQDAQKNDLKLETCSSRLVWSLRFSTSAFNLAFLLSLLIFYLASLAPWRLFPFSLSRFPAFRFEFVWFQVSAVLLNG